MPLLLHIETTGQVCSVALTEEEKILFLRESQEGLTHASLLTVYIDEIFREQGISGKDLDAVAVSIGPGSYTGLRIGVAAAKGICYAAGIPLIGINTLKAMCYGVMDLMKLSGHALSGNPNMLYCPMVDARRMEVYLALINSEYEFVSEIQAVILHDELFRKERLDKPVCFFGSGAAKAEILLSGINTLFFPGFLNSATHLITPALQAWNDRQFEDTAYFEPFYLKDFVATIPKKKI
jgi:tRNA threonylcarbamoyladenosine biosynthesis protein TsaB